ncbi:entericidin A/B family lipoprotein [Phragmitibacter flavus]|uniref:Entericidin A/B family lipoprotein n=1 Tax=Phragmitibacter flavus TaxID=2576071 RepID=A0A5R8K8R3_9BACT|nr:entericidin A/B family lipoprotein [Phragmitibacter flavus]TLD68708.1 entericidin A/B family lipoprotein [Phragmitibacter flavus]
MNTKRSLILLFLAIGTLTLSQCRTTQGLGEDVQHLGNRIERTAERATPY